MKNSVLKFAVIAAIFLVIASSASTFLLVEDPATSKLAEILGYATIVLSMAFIVFAMLEIRKKKGGHLSFKEAFRIGIIITIIVSAVFAVYSLVYYQFLDPDFTERYYASAIEQIERSDIPAEEKAGKIQHIEAAADMSMGMQALLMFVTAFAIGLIITIIAALVIPRLKTDFSGV